MLQIGTGLINLFLIDLDEHFPLALVSEGNLVCGGMGDRIPGNLIGE